MLATPRRPVVIRRITRRLGDTIHAWAVTRAVPGNTMARFDAYTPFAGLFIGQGTIVRANPRGSSWCSQPGARWPGPQHAEHVRDTMAAVAGADPGQLRVVLKPLPGVIHHGDYVLVCPHSAISYKEWPAASWAAVAEAVMARGLEVVVASQPARERPGMPAGVRFIDVSVPGMARLIARARCVVAPDSGPVHLADALGVSVVGLYAATSTMTYGPYRDRRFCIDVHREGFPAGVRYDSSKHLGSASMSGISVDQVTALVNASTGASSG